MVKITKRFLHAAHLAAAITVGLAITGMDEAPVRTVFITLAAFVVLWWSYKKMYPDKWGKAFTGSDTPIDDAVRRDLGIKD